MFGRDALTNLQHLIKPKLRYMGTSDLILDLEIMSNIYQAQIHNHKLARHWVIEDQKPVPNPDINTGDLVLVKDHTLKIFMPKYKTDFCVIRVLGNKVEVKVIMAKCLGITFHEAHLSITWLWCFWQGRKTELWPRKNPRSWMDYKQPGF